MNRRHFLAGLSAVCALAASGKQVDASALAQLTPIAKFSKVRHVSAYRIDSDDWVHRFDILVGPDEQFGVSIKSPNRMPEPSEIEPALQALADHIESITGGKYEFTTGPMLTVGDNLSMVEYRA